MITLADFLVIDRFKAAVSANTDLPVQLLLITRNLYTSSGHDMDHSDIQMCSVLCACVDNVPTNIRKPKINDFCQWHGHSEQFEI